MSIFLRSGTKIRDGIFCFAIRLDSPVESDIKSSDLAIIELGFKTEQEAKTLCDKVKAKKLVCLAIGPVSARFCAYQYGKHVIVVIIPSVNKYKHFDLMKKWQPQNEK